MDNINLSAKEIETLLIGRWRFDTDREKVFLEFKKDMTYEQVRIQTFFFSKPKEYITGNEFSGVWHVNDQNLCLIVKNVPKSMLNLQLSVLFKVSLADIIASLYSLFVTENYEVVNIDSSKLFMRYEKEPITAIRIH